MILNGNPEVCIYTTYVCSVVTFNVRIAAIDHNIVDRCVSTNLSNQDIGKVI